MEEKFIVHCDYCGKEFDLMDSNNCDISPCDCGKAYCNECFIHRYGETEFDSMMDAGENFFPDCWPEYKPEIMSR